MLWVTHIRITREVLRRLKIPESSEEAEELKKGVLEPDQWGDYPHHYGKAGRTRDYIMYARRHFLDDDLPNAYYSLGVALHYIQDSYTSLTSRSDNHNRWEQQIEEAFFTDNLERLVTATFYKRKDRKKVYLEILGHLSGKTEGKADILKVATIHGDGEWGVWGAPKVDLNFALRVSLLTAESVFGPKINTELQATLSHLLGRYKSTLMKTESTFCEKIVELILKRDDLEKRRGKLTSGIFPKLQGFFLTLLIKIRNLQVTSKMKDYEQQKHLKKVAVEYKRVAEKMSRPHADWYDVTIPQIDVSVVEKELLSIQEASKLLKIDASVIQDFIGKGIIAHYIVRNKKLIRRSELRGIPQTA